MARKKIGEVRYHNDVAVIYRDSDTKEFVVRLNGRAATDYFTDDRQDAQDTARAMVGITEHDLGGLASAGRVATVQPLLAVGALALGAWIVGRK